MTFPVSVCMIARDEEARIVASIASVMPYVEEVIVVDTGSEDATRERAAMLGARVYSHRWEHDFAAARNASLAYARAPYLLVMDADERLVQETGLELGVYCEQAGSAAGRVRICNQLEDGSHSVTEILRLFPNRPEYRYAGRVHEQVLLGGSVPPALSTGVAFLHDGYLPDALRQRDKIERNLSLLQRQLTEEPGSPYLLYQAGKTLHVGKRHAEALPYLQAAMERLAELGGASAFLPDLLLSHAYAALEVQDIERAQRVAGWGRQQYPDYTDLHFVYGLALIRSLDPARLREVREVFEHCLALGEADSSRYETVRGVGTFRAHYNLGVYHEVTGHLAEARRLYRLSAEQGFEKADERLRQL